MIYQECAIGKSFGAKLMCGCCVWLFWLWTMVDLFKVQGISPCFWPFSPVSVKCIEEAGLFLWSLMTSKIVTGEQRYFIVRSTAANQLLPWRGVRLSGAALAPAPHSVSQDISRIFVTASWGVLVIWRNTRLNRQASCSCWYRSAIPQLGDSYDSEMLQRIIQNFKVLHDMLLGWYNHDLNWPSSRLLFVEVVLLPSHLSTVRTVAASSRSPSRSPPSLWSCLLPSAGGTGSWLSIGQLTALEL